MSSFLAPLLVLEVCLRVFSTLKEACASIISSLPFPLPALSKPCLVSSSTPSLWLILHSEYRQALSRDVSVAGPAPLFRCDDLASPHLIGTGNISGELLANRM